VVFGGARIRYGKEVSRFVKCLPSSTGEVHHYDTEVRKNNFGGFWPLMTKPHGGTLGARAPFFFRINKTEILMVHMPLYVANDQFNRKCSFTCLLCYRNKKSSATYVDQIGSSLGTLLKRKFIVFVIK
jgi:hypothetical protein